MTQLSLLEQARLRYPEKNDPEHVARLAADIIRELALEPPIDLGVIASYRGISDIRIEDLDCSGSLTPEQGRFVMRLRRDDSRARRRFTGFHEVGHTLLPGYSDRPVFRCSPALQIPARSSSPSATKEALADAAAAEFLLPGDFVEADLQAADFGLDTVTALADRYEAGVQASANRFVQLWPEPVLLVILELANKPRDVEGAARRWRVQSSWASPDDCWPFVPKWKSASMDGALARASIGEVIRESATLEELGLDDSRTLDLSARLFSYRAGVELRQRVFALYRPQPIRKGRSRHAA